MLLLLRLRDLDPTDNWLRRVLVWNAQPQRESGEGFTVWSLGHANTLQPTHAATLGEAAERAARANAEDQLSRLQVNVEADTGEREARRQATSRRVGRWTFRVALIGLVAVYLLATAIVALATTVVIAGIVAAGLLGLIGVLSWAFHLDAFAAAHWVETRIAGRFRRWLDSFETDEHG